nr:unnamed protein product [Callosobruchus analis]
MVSETVQILTELLRILVNEIASSLLQFKLLFLLLAEDEKEVTAVDLNVILSEKGKQLLVVNNFKYSFQKCLKSGERRWICLNKKCKSFILSLGEIENVTVTNHITEHCHEANPEKLNRQIVSSSCKRKATGDLSEKPAKMIRRVLQDNLPSTITTCDVAYVRRNMYFFTVHGYYNGHYIPLVFPLLPNKLGATYQKLFNILIDICNKYCTRLEIFEIVIDFEKASIRLLKKFGLRHKYRIIQKYGLIPMYKAESSEVGRWLKMTFALTLLNPEEVSDCFVFDLLSIAPQF